MKKKKRYGKEPSHIWHYLRQMGVPDVALTHIKEDLMYWALTEGESVRAGRIFTVIGDILYDQGKTQEDVVQFLQEFSSRIEYAYDKEGKPWARYYREVAEKTGWVFQEVGDDMIQLCEVDFSDEWEIKEGNND